MERKALLVACEESQRVTAAFRAKGVEAYSCDILEPSGGHPEWHIKGDVKDILGGGWFRTLDGIIHYVDKWFGIIAFPPCTYLTCTGNKWFGLKYDPLGEREEKRQNAIRFFKLFWDCSAPFVAIENPVGVMSTILGKPAQIIQPYLFGEPYEKKTCLWLRGFPLLKKTDLVNIPPRVKFASGKSMAAWYADLWKLPKEKRALERSKTFLGVAQAMADQWSPLFK